MNIEDLQADIQDECYNEELTEYFEQMIAHYEYRHVDDDRIKFNKLYEEFPTKFKYEQMPNCFDLLEIETNDLNSL